MITPLNFIERVMPWPGPEGPGWVNLHWKFTGDDGKPRWRGQPFKEASALIERAQYLCQHPSKAEDIYFCTTVQASCDTHPKGFYIARRKAENATLTKAIWLDVDVKEAPKGYPTIDEAVDAIFDFCTKANLPDPSAFIGSGGGVHAYWFSERPLSITEWRPFAEGLRAEAVRLGLRFDQGVTTDPARILRLPGTYNRKIKDQPRSVKIRGKDLGRDYDFAKDLKRLYAIGEPKVTVPVTRKQPQKSAPYDVSGFEPMSAVWANHPIIKAAMETRQNALSAGIARTDLPLDPTRAFKECQVLQNSLMTGGKKDGQGLWNLVVLASTWFKNGRGFAYDMSRKYLSYSEEETDALFDRKMDERERKGLGWPSCKAIEREGGKCQGCPFHNQDLGSPLNLCERTAPPIPLGVAAVAPGATAAVVTAEDLYLPPGYILSGEGKICFCPPPKKGDPDPHPIPIFHGHVIARPWTRGGMNGINSTLHFKYRQGDNYKEVVIPYQDLGSDHAVTKALSSQTVMINLNALVLPFMRAWVAEIDTANKRYHTQAVGWVMEDGRYRGFAYGGRLYKIDGTEEDCGVPDKVLEPIITPCGTMAPILDCFRHMLALHPLLGRELMPLEALCLQSWASPLVEHSSHKAAIAWGYSNASAYGKSAAIFTGAALWCSPGKYKEVPGVTVVHLESKMDQVKNLPVIADEITDDGRLDKISDALQSQPEGKQGGRNNRDGKMRDEKSWKNILVCGGNTSLLDHQFKRKVDTDARAQRILEFRLTYKLEGVGNNFEVGRSIELLDNNYGHLGRVYAQYLATHISPIQDRIKQVFEELGKRAEIKGQERFWQSLGAVTIVASELANEILMPHIGSPVFHTAELFDYIVSVIRTQREWVDTHIEGAGTHAATQGLMAQVLEKFHNNVLVTDRVPSGKGDKSPITWLNVPPDNSGRGNPIYVQVVQKPQLIRIDFNALRSYLTSDEIGKGGAAISALMKQYGGSKHRNCNMTANIEIGYAKPRVDVWEIEIPNEDHPLFETWHSRAHSSKNMGFKAAVPAATPVGLP